MPIEKLNSLKDKGAIDLAKILAAIPPGFRHAHASILKFGQSLGYPIDAGCCNGVTLRWLEACLLHEELKFIDRIEKISSVNSEVLLGQINAARAKVKEKVLLTEDESALLEVLAFFDSIKLYQSPFDYASIFNQELNQRQVDEISPFASSEGIKGLGGLKTIYSESGIYTIEELAVYLDSVKDIIEKNAQSVGFLLTNHNHAIGLHYDVKKHAWTCMDINQWPPFESNDSTKIAEKIYAGFDQGKHHLFTAFNTRIITMAQTAEKNISLLRQLKQFGKCHLDLINSAIAERKEEVSLLHVAIDFEQFEVAHALIKALVSNGKITNLNLVTSNGSTALFIAAQGGRLEVVKAIIKALVDKGRITDINLARTDGTTPLLIAADNGHLEVVKSIIQALVDNGRITDLNLARASGATPLLIAAQHGHFEVVKAIIKALVDKGRLADLNLARADGANALLMAAQNGHIEVVKAIIDALVDKDRVTDLSLALASGLTPLFIAAQNGHLEVVKAIIKAIVDKGSITNLSLACTDGLTPLYIAAQNGHLEVVKAIIKALVDKGRMTDLNLACSDGATPLFVAARNGHLETVKVLIKTLVDSNKRNELNLPATDGTTPIFMAASKGYFEIAKALLYSAADPNLARTTDGMTPLAIAAQYGHIDVVKLFLQNSATIKPSVIKMNSVALLKFIADKHPIVIPKQIEGIFRMLGGASMLPEETISITPDQFVAIYEPLPPSSTPSTTETAQLVLTKKEHIAMVNTLLEFLGSPLSRALNNAQNATIYCSNITIDPTDLLLVNTIKHKLMESEEGKHVKVIVPILKTNMFCGFFSPAKCMIFQREISPEGRNEVVTITCNGINTQEVIDGKMTRSNRFGR